MNDIPSSFEGIPEINVNHLATAEPEQRSGHRSSENDAMSKHTPTPWFVGYPDGSGVGDNGYCITAADGCPVRSGDSFGLLYGIEKKEDAAFIVKAVNNHDALVRHLHHLATVCCDEDALRLLDSLNAVQASEVSGDR